MCTFKASTHYVSCCGDVIEVEREAWINPFVCTHRTYVYVVRTGKEKRLTPAKRTIN